MIVARIERLEAADIRDTDTTFPAASATCRGGSCALPGKADYCFGRKAVVRKTAALHGKQYSAERYCVGDVGGETRGVLLFPSFTETS